ncbi:DNA-directed RNA polymerase subunit beta [Anaerobacillus sp. MEB173]|uniref:DNA-directed RNA polymerase subunit beta n=1 Tax=Anaerobacillus sp. MEB173 TaxID=3383345 RepID=UPI003F90D218
MSDELEKREKNKKAEQKEEKQKQEPHNENRRERRKRIRKQRKGRIRLIPIWLRLIIIIFLAAASLVAGLVVGYGIIGDGHPADALKVETWQHIVNIVTEGTEKN